MLNLVDYNGFTPLHLYVHEFSKGNQKSLLFSHLFVFWSLLLEKSKKFKEKKYSQKIEGQWRVSFIRKRILKINFTLIRWRFKCQCQSLQN